MKHRLLPICTFLLLGVLIIGSVDSNPNRFDPAEDNKVKNIILIIGDGMGFEQLELASLVEYGSINGLFMQSPNFIQSEIETSSTDAIVTDSGASATAIATGVKTHNEAIGVDKNDLPLETILEYAESLGKATGLVSSMRFNDATPGAFAAHVPDRHDEDEIADQMSVSGAEVVLGGGADEKQSATVLTGEGYKIVQTKQELLDVNTATTTKLWGTYHSRTISWESEMDYLTDVRLFDMVNISLDILDNNDQGFFTLIESGMIDFSGHGEFEPQNKVRNALEVIHLDNIVKYVIDWVESNPDTLIIIAADHETGGLNIDSTANLDLLLPDQNESENLKRQRRIDRTNQISISWSNIYHTSQNVPFIVFGKHAERLVHPGCEYSNANIYGVMKNAMDGTLPTQCPEFIEGSQTASKVVTAVFSTPVTTSSSTTTSTVNSSTFSSLHETTSSNQNETPYIQNLAMLVLLIIPRKFKKRHN